MTRDGNRKGSSLKEIAYASIAEWIITDELETGAPLVESELAERLGMSRTPIREALHRLEQDGLVEILPRRGGIVTRLSSRDLEEFYEVREALDGMAARLAATRGNQDHWDAIDQSFRSADEEHDEQKRLEKYQSAGDHLHLHVMQASANRRLQRVNENSRFQIRRERHIVASIPGRIEQSAKEHRAILEALKRRDADDAEARMREHVVSTKESVIELYRRFY
jgi:DNA-binding GntR family transcriptional regulator